MLQWSYGEQEDFKVEGETTVIGRFSIDQRSFFLGLTSDSRPS